ncbi:MAG: vitamin K epoxide reductase family protein [Patescibacteria group bacterium]
MTAPRWYPFTVLGVSIVGFFDAAYLTIQHYTQFTLPCTITHGCDLVTKSEYSQIMGIPVSVLGAVYYLAIFLAVYVILETKKTEYLRFVAIATTFGFLFSAWFVYLQFFVIHAICQYCMFSAATSTTMFVVSIVFFSSEHLKNITKSTHSEVL